MIKVILLPSAREDLLEGRRFYEAQQNGLGTYFTQSLLSDLESLGSYAGIHGKAFGFHRLLSKRFPYFIYYSKEADAVVVKAILDCRRNPVWIKKKLRQA